MLSILIPTYNYDVVSLVKEIHKQATEANIVFEIICLDDASKKYSHENKSSIENLSNVSYLISTTNNGSIHCRQLLSEKAKYNKLLFLDADVIPKQDSFIKTYVSHMLLKKDAVFGGYSYTKEKEKKGYILRKIYGKKHEEINAKIRNLDPYRVILSGNFLIKKEVFNKINSIIKLKSYGLDNYFAILLKQHNIKVNHIDNQVYHLGIEKNDVYLIKVEEAVKTLLSLVMKKKMNTHSNKLLSTFVLFKRYKLNYIVIVFFNIFKSSLKKNLLSNRPSLFLLQLYKLSYMCYKDSEIQ